MQVNDVIKCLESFAPLSLQEDYDNSGLQIGNKSDLVTGILLALDCTEEVIYEAIQKKSNLIIVHHPLIFKPIISIQPNSLENKIILLAIKNNISIYACHTNLDNLINGVNAKIAEKLQVKNLQIIEPKLNQLSKITVYTPTTHLEELKNALFEAGCVEIGNYSNCSFSFDGVGIFNPNQKAKPQIGNNNLLNKTSETCLVLQFDSINTNQVIHSLNEYHPYEEPVFYITQLQKNNYKYGSGLIGELTTSVSEAEILNRLQKIFNAKVIKHSKLLNKSVKKIAICGGSGSFLILKAKKLKADIYITSDLKYHNFFEAENQLLLADIGHFESEQYTSEIIYEVLIKNNPKFAIHFTQINTNPILYHTKNEQ